MTQLHFETSFWSQKQSGQTLPDFTTGLKVLHQKLNQSKVENDEIIRFFQDRIAVEEQYANRLGQVHSFQASGFDADDGATLKRCFRLLKQTNLQHGEQHKTLIESLHTSVLNPLVRLQDEYKQRVNNSKQALELSIKQFDSLAKDVERAKQVYHRRCRDANLAEEQALRKATTNNNNNSQQSPVSPTDSELSNDRKNSDGNNNSNYTLEDGAIRNNNSPTPNQEPTSIQLGNQVLTIMEYDQLVQTMHTSVPTQDYRVPILGKYSHTSSGENIARWLQQNLAQCKDSPAMADVVGQQLIQPYGALRLVGQRGNKFIASPSSFYQWRGMAFIENEENNSGMLPTGNGGPLGGFFDRKSTLTALTGDEPHKKARNEAQRADEAYQTALKRVDQMRMKIDEALFAHFAEMEKVEIQRINTIKQAFTEYTSSLSTSLPADKSMIEEMVANQESLKPDQDIQYIIQQYYVAGFSPKAILYENYYHGIAHDQIFGVPLTELAKHETEKVPAFIKCLLEAIEETSKDMDADEKKSLWSTRISLDKVHSLRTDINIGTSRVTKDMLLQHNAGLLVALLRLYLLELPQCLFTFELYDAAHALYSNNGQDTSLLLAPVSHLISSLPAPHFETLRLLMDHVSRYIKDNEIPDETIAVISQALGTVILRNNKETLTTSTSRVPSHLTMDLIKHYDIIFSETTIQAQMDSEKRRQARPLIVTDNTTTTTPSSSSVESPTTTDSATSNNKRRSGIMSFMRPGGSIMDDSKWNFGVFRSNSQQQPGGNGNDSSSSSVLTTTSTTTSSTTTSSTRRSFTPSTITHYTPPLLPQNDDAIISTTPVMFDINDHVTQKRPSDATTAAEAILNDIDDIDDDGHHELDPFFDDD